MSGFLSQTFKLPLLATRDPYVPQATPSLKAGYRGVTDAQAAAWDVWKTKTVPMSYRDSGIAGLDQTEFLGATWMSEQQRNSIAHDIEDLWTGLQASKTRLDAIPDDAWKLAQTRAASAGLPVIPAKVAFAGLASRIADIKSARDSYNATFARAPFGLQAIYKSLYGFDYKVSTDAYKTLMMLMDSGRALLTSSVKVNNAIEKVVSQDEMRKIRDIGFQKFMELAPERYKPPMPVIKEEFFPGIPNWVLYGVGGLAAVMVLSNVTGAFRKVG